MRTFYAWGRSQRSATPLRTIGWSRSTRDASRFDIFIGMEVANRTLNQIHNVQAAHYPTLHNPKLCIVAYVLVSVEEDRNENGKPLIPCVLVTPQMETTSVVVVTP